MNRDTAIEAGRQAIVDLLLNPPPDRTYSEAPTHAEVAAAVIDAAAPHLTPEPIGYAVVLNLHERELLNDGAIRTRGAARDLALALRLSGETPTVVALVPVDEP